MYYKLNNINITTVFLDATFTENCRVNEDIQVLINLIFYPWIIIPYNYQYYKHV